MRRPSRDIQTFNLSMLDVICSGLGAFLILFILANQEADRSKAQAAQAAAAAAAAKAEAEQARRELERERQKARVAAIQKGKAIGMCQVADTPIRISVRDFGSVDGDRVHLSFNGDVLDADCGLTASLREFRLDLPVGPSYFVAKALNEGDSPPNTAEVVVTPCQNGQPKTFQWQMKTGESNNVSIERQ